MVLQAEGMVLEMVRGSSDVYLNDKLQKMDAPVLYYDKMCYLPLSVVLEGGGLGLLTVGESQLIYALAS